MHIPRTALTVLVIASVSSATRTARSETVICEPVKLIAPDGSENAEFGWSVAVFDDIVVIGAPGDSPFGTRSGSAYLFRYDGSNWVLESKLLASEGNPDDEFGRSVAIYGDTAVIGAPGDRTKGTSAGAVYVFRYTPGPPPVWPQETKLVPADGLPGDRLGHAVALWGDIVVAGAPEDDDLGLSSGSAYVFRFDRNSWSEEAKLLASDGATGDSFGFSVAVGGQRAVVGARLDDDDGIADTGSAYVFRREFRPSGVAFWEERAKLGAPPVAQDEFGIAVAISGGATVIGANKTDNLGENTGSAYVYRRDVSHWVEEAVLYPPDVGGPPFFGSAVSLSGNRAVVGAPGDTENGTLSGAAYTYLYDPDSPGLWVREAKVLAPDGAEGDHFGLSVAVSGAKTVIGAFGDNEKGLDSGSVYMFDLTDLDGDAVGDACDLCPDTPTGLLVDEDGCTVPVGPCCFPDESCIEGQDAVTCLVDLGGTYPGDGLTCGGDPDGDEAFGCDDGCPIDPDKREPGICGCGFPDTDTDSDGVANCLDHCPETPPDVPVNDCGCPEAGACCLSGGFCIFNVERSACSGVGQVYQGDGSACHDGCGFGDLDGSGNVDLADFARLQVCFTAAGGDTGECSNADVDGCRDIDLEDFRAFQDLLTGPSSRPTESPLGPRKAVQHDR